MLEFKNITKVFKNQTVIKDTSFAVNKGEFIVIVGKNRIWQHPEFIKAKDIMITENSLLIVLSNQYINQEVES